MGWFESLEHSIFEFVSCIQPLSATLGFKDLRRCFKSEAFSRTVIKPVFDLCQMILGDLSQVGFLRQETPHQANCVLYRASFVTVEGFAKVRECSQNFIGAHMLGVLRAVVVSDGAPYFGWIATKPSD